MDLSKLKILHISTQDNGGAGIAALRLHKGLLEKTVSSKFLCLRKAGHEKNVFQYDKRRKLNLLQKIFQKLGFSQLKELKNDLRLQKAKGNYEIFTFPESDIDLLSSPLIEEADIINLHWIGYFVDYHSFFRKVKKPVVWTFHDKNPVLGGFHLLLDKEKNPTMALLENELADKKNKWINQHKNIHIVSPSKFLMNYSRSSETFKGYPHHCIPNAVDTAIYKLQDKLIAKREFGLPEDKINVLFLNTGGFHKGSDMVFSCIQERSFKNLHFVALGGNFQEATGEVTFIGAIDDEILLSRLYAAADVFLMPSREDNLPNMMLESLLCGTPVLATVIGGITDVIKSGFNGYLAKEVTAEAVGQMLQLLDDGQLKFDSADISTHASQNFSLPVQANSYIDLYSEILKNQ